MTGAFRAFDLQRYQWRKSSLATDEAAEWQKRYQAGAMVQATAIGLWCSITLFATDDAVAHMIALSVTTGLAAGGAGRAYGRRWIFQLQVSLIFGPIVIALALRGTPYYIAMSVVCAVFLATVMKISANLHRIFMRALVAREREAAIAGQFDTALNNMPHGLCMFRADGRLAVMNNRFREMMNLSDAIVDRRTNAADIVDACVLAGSISSASGTIILSEIEDSQARDIITTDPDVARGRSLSWKFQPMADGGAVVLLEDITERRNAEARISHLARYDELTALPNRVHFRDEIERLLTAPRAGRPALRAAVHRSRPVQAGQRYAGPSLRRRAVVRGRRTAARHAAAGATSWRASAATSSWCSSTEHPRQRGCRGPGAPHRRCA